MNTAKDEAFALMVDSIRNYIEARDARANDDLDGGDLGAGEYFIVEENECLRDAMEAFDNYLRAVISGDAKKDLGTGDTAMSATISNDQQGTEDWRAARDVIASALSDFGLQSGGSSNSYACAILARLAQHEPPILTEVVRDFSDPPAWHDRPTGPGLWVAITNRGEAETMSVRDVEHPECWRHWKRFYGPIPQDKG